MKYRKGFLTLAIVGIAAAVSVFALSYFNSDSYLPEGLNLSQIDSDFVKYCSQNKKRYMTKEEFLIRSRNYVKAREHINMINEQQNITWTEEANKFADMTPEELEKYKGLIYDPNLTQRLQMAVESGDLEVQKTDHLLTQSLTPINWST